MSVQARHVRFALVGALLVTILLACGSATYIFSYVAKRPRAVRMLEAAGHEVEAYAPPAPNEILKEPETDRDVWMLSVSGGSELSTLAEVAPDMKRLEELVIGEGKYVDCEPLRSFSQQLKGITLFDCPIVDVSVLCQLIHLETIDLHSIETRTIPHLAKLTKLKMLHVSNVPLSNLNCIANLNVELLWLESTKLTDLSAIRTLGQLKAIVIEEHPAVDLAPIASVRSLERLSLTRVAAGEFKWLAKCDQLLKLNLWDMPIGEFPRIDDSQLRDLTLVNTTIRDIQSISALSQLQKLNICDTPIDDLTPLAGLQNLQGLYLRNTNVVDLTPLSRMKKLSDLDISETNVRDLTPLYGLPELLYLRVSSTSIPTSQIQKFKSMQQNCTVQTD